MNRSMKSAVAGGLVLLLGVSAVLWSQEQPSPAEQEAMMEAWMELAVPGEPHKKLAALVGEWDVVTRMYMAGPDSDPVESKAYSKITAVLGGRFIQEQVVGEFAMPNVQGGIESMKFEGLGLTGYDNYKKAYISTWADSMGTMLLLSKGTYNPSKPDDITFYGEMPEPGLGIQDRYIKYHKKMVNKDKFIFTMYDLAVSENHKVMELVYNRKK